ncbi:MAG: hypothetical protein FOGNACKC_01366 [Anaerolineae bacterium]|nr:hypothetical protein [Anaerolineae bacterium]
MQRCLRHLMPQTRNRPIEVIVPYDSAVTCVEQLRQDFPQVIFVNLGAAKISTSHISPGAAHELYDRRTAKGLRVARGEILASLEDFGVPAPDWCEQILEAHRLPYGVIGGAVEQEGKGALNWAVYFLDFGRYQLPLPEGPADYLSDVNVSYKREALNLVGELWAERYNEVTVHWALARKGVVLWRRPQLIVHQDRGRLLLPDLVKERFWWGRLFATARAREISVFLRSFYILFIPIMPLLLLARMSKKVFAGRRNRRLFLLSFPQTTLLTLFWCVGELAGYLSVRESPQ